MNKPSFRQLLPYIRKKNGSSASRRITICTDSAVPSCRRSVSFCVHLLLLWHCSSFR